MADATLADASQAVYPPVLSAPAMPSAAPPALTPKPDYLADNARLVEEQAAAQAALEQRRQAEQDPLRQQAQTANTALSQAVAQPVKQVPMPAQQPSRMDPKTLNDTASMLMTLGAFMGLRSRQPFTAALNNMSAAMEGAQKGDQQQFERATAEYNAAFNHALAQNRMLLAEREAVIKDKNLDLTAKNNALHLLDVKYDTQLKNLNMPFVMRMRSNDAHQKAVEYADQKNRDFQNSVAIERMRQLDRLALAGAKGQIVPPGGAGGSAGLTPAAISMFSEMNLRGIKPPDISGRKEVAAEKIRVANALAEKYAADGSVPSQIQVNRDMQSSLASSLKKMTERVAGMELSGKKIEKDIKTIESYIKEGNPDHWKIVNAKVNMLRDAFSDPTLAPYALAVKQVAIEYERNMTTMGSMSIAQLHEGAREDASKMLSGDMDIATVNATLPVMLREMANAREAGKELQADMRSQIAAIGGKSTEPVSAPANSLPPGWSVKVK